MLTIQPMQPDDWEAVAAIYAAGIAGGNATFETTVPTWETWDSNHRPDCRLTGWIDGQLAGWAALAPVSRRQVYAGVAEVSLYVSSAARGQGVGKGLMLALIAAAENAGIWTLQASIFPENVASMALHQQFGFRLTGRRERIAQHYGCWRDTLLLERRSRQVGWENG